MLISLLISVNLKKQPKTKQTPWSESSSELYRPSDLRLLAKLVPTFADRGLPYLAVHNPFNL
jgi:hypothetical protein